MKSERFYVVKKRKIPWARVALVPGLVTSLVSSSLFDKLFNLSASGLLTCEVRLMASVFGGTVGINDHEAFKRLGREGLGLVSILSKHFK